MGRSHCMHSGEADRLAPCQTRSRVRGHMKTLLRDRGARGSITAVDVDTRHARICPRSGAQVNQHQPLLHAIPRTLKRLGISHQVESGEPFTAERNLRMDIVTRRGSLRDAPNREYTNKSTLLDVAHADPQGQVHLRGGSADHDGSAAPTSEARKR